jgi:hypothetical protein
MTLTVLHRQQAVRVCAMRGSEAVPVGDSRLICIGLRNVFALWIGMFSAIFTMYQEDSGLSIMLHEYAQHDIIRLQVNNQRFLSHESAQDTGAASASTEAELAHRLRSYTALR